MEAVKEELDIFQLLPNQSMITNSFVEKVNATGNVNQNQILFEISASSGVFIDPSYVYYHVIGNIYKDDKLTNLTNEKIGPINNFGQSIWKSVGIEFNDKLVQSNTNVDYAYRGYFETLLNFGEDAKQSILQCQLFYKDTAGKMDSDEENNGLK
jgi:hypothetical protein